jgi:LysR family transcriptional regulator, regulator for bpeEF and oprC
VPASLDELRAFTAVYEAGGFTAASKRLALTTNAVSLRVQKLEEGLGARLFVRTTRSVSPTEEGRAFYRRVVRVLGELEEAADDLRPKSDGLRGTVRIAVPGALATRPFLERLRDLLEQHPALVVQTRVSSTPVNIIS